jgi:lactoylglutathione lyase
MTNMKKIALCLFLICCATSLVIAQSSAKPKASLNHIAVYVMDLKKSSDFYAQVVGLDTIPEPFHDGRHTWFSVGPKSHLHVISGAKQITDHDKNAHLCFTVASVTDFIGTLKARNIPFESWTGEKNTYTNRVDGVKQIYFQDPDGYWIEINDARE